MDLLALLCTWIDVYYYFALALLTLIALTRFERKKVFVIALFLAVILSVGAKQFYGLDRPCAGEDWCPDSYGFPSIHSTIASVFLVASLGSPWIFLFIPASALVAYSRVLLGVHSVPQVMAGLAMGAVAYFAVYALLEHFKDNELVKKHGLLK